MTKDTCIFKMTKDIKKKQNVIRADCSCLESYLGETNVKSLIIEKPNVWSLIIANFSFFYSFRGKLLRIYISFCFA